MPSTAHRADIVLCRFPTTEAPDQPGPISRPTLLLGVFIDPVDGARYAMAAYGTTRFTGGNSGFEIPVTETEHRAVAGVDRKMKFVRSRIRILPLSAEFFKLENGDLKTLGKLTGASLHRFDQLCDCLAATSAELGALLKQVGKSAASYSNQAEAMTAQQADAYLQKTCTGRADLNGAANAVVFARSLRSDMVPAEATGTGPVPITAIRKKRCGFLRRRARCAASARAAQI
jgi:hypothetical protein